MSDRRCRFGLAARIEMVRRRRAGESLRQIAVAMACSPTTVKTQIDRWNAASDGERADFSCLHPRRPVPRSCPHALSAQDEQRILQARARTNWGPMRLTILCGRHRSTIWKVLKRHGVSRRRRGERQTYKRFEWSQPGALLHIDAYKAPKFIQPGHKVTGDRTQRARGLGHTVLIAVQDDHTRLVYAELHGAENATNVSITLKRAARWFTARLRAGRGGDERQRQVLQPQPRLPRHAYRAGRPAHPEPALHATLERKDRAVLRNPRRRMGARPRLAQQHHPRPRPQLVHPILQPLQATLSRRRQTAHHPRPLSPRAGQLAAAGPTRLLLETVPACGGWGSMSLLRLASVAGRDCR